MTTLTMPPANTIVFPSKIALEKALEPLHLDEIRRRISASTTAMTLDLQYDETLSSRKVVPLRNPGTGNLLNTVVHQTKTLTVFYPETPRVPHHLTIALNRRDIQGITDIHEDENVELFATIKTIAEIYKTLAIRGFVVAQFDTPQQGHFDRYVVEIIPHLPGFNDIKNIVDKVDSNRYVLFRTANLSPIAYKIPPEEISDQATVWQAAFQKEQTPLTETDTKITFPYCRKESHQQEADKVLYHQLLELLQDQGGVIADQTTFEAIMPTDIPETIKPVTVDKCFFCDSSIVDRQLVYQYGRANVFYNMRKGAKAGSCFLILPHRHTEKVYGLTPEEIHDISILRKALVAVLKETHPECEVVVYTQDDPALGQTVFHSHEQVVAVDPQTIALTWTMMSLYPSGNVSEQEMADVCREFRLKLEQKIKETTPLEQSA
ncbi:MAG: HIT domain-containing protein [Anaplasmataceae bacterium]|nr:HIT domain-containing protein [Anaplasmataceae bacterium]